MNLYLSQDDLAAIYVGDTASSTAEGGCLDVRVSGYTGYLGRLAAGKKEDFDGLIWRSASLVHRGQTRFVRDKGREHGDVSKLRFILIDEFQDFSQMFFELV